MLKPNIKASFVLALFGIFICKSVFAQSWVPLNSNQFNAKFLKYISNEATHLMLHDSSCNRAENYVHRINKLGDHRLCIATYQEFENGKIDWNSWKVYFGSLQENHYLIDLVVLFDSNRNPIEKIEETVADTGEVYHRALAAKVTSESIQPQLDQPYEFIVIHHRTNVVSVYAQPYWQEGEEYYLGNDYQLLFDISEEKILGIRKLHKDQIVLPMIPKNDSIKASYSTNLMHSYPTPTDFLMVYRRRGRGPGHMVITKKNWGFYIDRNGNASYLGSKEFSNEN